MSKTSQGGEAPLAASEDIADAAAPSDRIARIQGILARVKSLPDEAAKTILEDEAVNLRSFLDEDHGKATESIKSEIRTLLK